MTPKAPHWFDNLPPRVQDSFRKEFCNNDSRMVAALKSGHWQPGVKRSIKMYKWCGKRRLVVRLCDIRPDIWGLGDQGP